MPDVIVRQIMKSKINIIRKKRILLTWGFVAVLAVLILFSNNRWEHIGVWSTIFFLMGAVLVGCATIGRLWCSLYISGHKDKSLIKTGPYSVCRNPLYFFSFLGAAGVGLATEMLTIPAIIIAAFVPYYAFVIKEEQKKLAKTYGEEFDDYCKTTPAFFPSFKLLNEPEEYNVKAKAFRKSLFDALWFIWLVGILELIESFHELGLIPVFIKLY